MAVFKCKMCGGTLEFEPGATVGVCDYCGTKQTLPRLDDDRRVNLYDRANHFRRSNEFDKAAGIYEQILNEDATDAEAYWSLVLCHYGIEYVEDPATHKRVPTVNRAQFTSIFDDGNYKSALQYADGLQRAIYEEEAAAINEIQKGILAISQKEEPFDVFICYKETDQNGRRTPDSVLANDLYHQLTQEGFKVFFSRITLEDKLGTAYEPYIFAALNSAKVMVVLGTRPEYFKAVWVKNEWSRYLSLVKQSGGKKVLIPAYRDMDPYDLPDEFSHLQAQDMSKLGFMQDLIRGIKKLVNADEPKPAARETVVVNTAANASAAPLLRRAFMFLEDGDWAKADDFCEQVLNLDPENAQAYLGKLMAELKVRRQEELPDCAKPFDGSSNYQKAVRFGGELGGTLKGYIDHINERNELNRKTGIYDGAVKAMNDAKNEAAYKAAADTFRMIPGFRDADALAEQCLEKAEISRKDATYASARSKMRSKETTGYEYAISLFHQIPGWKDADEQIKACEKKIEEIKAKQEADRRERERKAEEARIAAEKAAKKRKKVLIISAAAIAAAIAIALLAIKVIIPSVKYNNAVKLLETGKYDEAIAAFEAMEGYKDSAEKIVVCKTEKASVLLESGDYENAYSVLKDIGKDDEVTANMRERGMALLEAGDYEAAYALLEETGNSDTVASSKYDRALSFIDSGDYEAAYMLLDGLNYNDSVEKKESIKPQYERILLSKAQVGDYVVFGSYEQDNNISNGKEDIEWLVLAKEGNRVLVISRYALDCQKYNSSDARITWETCSLRKWLNWKFINGAFSTDEQNLIQSTTVTADKNPSFGTSPGNNTNDKVFLLSITEVNKYFSSDSARQCQATAYAKSQGAYTSLGNDNCVWWLRSPGRTSNYAAVVSDDGSVDDRGGNDVPIDVFDAVRPALWIDLGS